MVLDLAMDLQLLLYSYATLFLVSLVIVISMKKRRKLPPGPTTLPIIGHLHYLSPLLHQNFHKLSITYGPLMYLKIGSIGCIVGSTPQMEKELLKTHEHTFSARFVNTAMDHLTYNNASFAFAPSGPYWKFLRKFSMFELLGHRNLTTFLPVRTNELHHFVTFLLGKSKAGETVNMTQELLKVTSNIISRMMFSIRCSGTGDQADAIRRLVREITGIFGEFNVADTIWLCKKFDIDPQGFQKRFENIHSRFDSMLEKIIVDREQVRTRNKQGTGDDNAKDFLDMMLDLFEDDKAEIKITKNNMKALVLDFLTAATDATAVTLEWALVELIKKPEVLKKAQKEIDEVVGQTRLVQEFDTPNLPYLQAVIKETFRLHPPVPMIARKSINECKIDKYTIPSESLLFVNVWSIGRNPDVWKDPMMFRPERFLDGNNNIDVKGFHYELLPFGTGRRGCPGTFLTMQELPVFLAAFLQCFDLKMVGATNTDGDDIDMSERPGLTVPRAVDLNCVLVERFTPTDLFAT